MPLDLEKKAKREKKHRATPKGKATHLKSIRTYKAKNVNTIEIKRDTFEKIKKIKDAENLSWTETIEKLVS